ncbi:Fe-S cluster assembly factor HCF101, chloroplastic [Tanacetum coccineum]|uniref:Fe-S cluster assembly factor HCF101, chloroplastic n=1 Tax=Tanacetum coccineum TaxID=301880 RepID=A0ABQ5IV02_9ASTR
MGVIFSLEARDMDTKLLSAPESNNTLARCMASNCYWQQITSSGWPFVSVVLSQMTHLVANITLNSARSCVMQSVFLTQGTLVIIVAVVGVGVTVVVIIVAVVVVVESSSVVKLSSSSITFPPPRTTFLLHRTLLLHCTSTTFLSPVAIKCSIYGHFCLCTKLTDASSLLTLEAENDALKALSQIIDPDFGTNIVSCGFVKDLDVDDISGEFEKQANEVVAALPCVQKVKVVTLNFKCVIIFCEQIGDDQSY